MFYEDQMYDCDHEYVALLSVSFGLFCRSRIRRTQRDQFYRWLYKSAANLQPADKQRIEDSMYFMDFAIQEMTGKKHKLGKVRIIHEPRESYHVNWVDDAGGAGSSKVSINFRLIANWYESGT